MKIKKKIIFFILLSLALLAGVIIFLIFPTLNNIRNLGNDILNQKIEVEKKFENRYSLRDYMKKLKKVQVSSEELSKNFVKPDEELNLVTALEDAAAKNNLDQKINIGSEINKQTKSKELSLELTGDYLSLLKYLYALRRLDYMINIKSCSLSSLHQAADMENENNAANKLSIKISAIVFYQ